MANHKRHRERRGKAKKRCLRRPGGGTWKPDCHCALPFVPQVKSQWRSPRAAPATYTGDHPGIDTHCAKNITGNTNPWIYVKTPTTHALVTNNALRHPLCECGCIAPGRAITDAHSPYGVKGIIPLPPEACFSGLPSPQFHLSRSQHVGVGLFGEGGHFGVAGFPAFVADGPGEGGFA